ncbi:hypothetical protein JOB18_031915 [Solea senegalensis]|uniref:Uncharacterized protein n=1 Tax=Solea senegalensis TaxID=28829 RepID=A0AAV6Q6I5_SOLSE|nr:hypothetical protein JOB18_031915 [Solea senegalensis]
MVAQLISSIIAEVTEPTDWCALIVPSPKCSKDGVRVCVDLKRRNKGVKLERYTLHTGQHNSHGKPMLAAIAWALHYYRTTTGSCGQLPSVPADADRGVLGVVGN